MSKGSGNPAGRRPSSRNAKPYDANNSFVRKVATKVTDFIPQSSWISKWFNPLQSNEDVSEDRENTEEMEDDTQQPPPNKRSRICMDTIHPPGTFSIQTRAKSALNTMESSQEQYPVHNEREDFSELATAGPSGIGRLISSTPAMQADIRTVTSHKSDLNLASPINNGIINGIDDNSESSESTSGCSSLIPQINRHEGPSNLYNSTFPSRKRHIDDKLTFTNHLQSPRSLFLDSNSRDTLSSRRPSFNASVVTNVLDRSSPLSSPFYSGNITFGGANAAGFYKQSRNLFNNSSELQLKVPRRTNVEVKPSNAVVDSSGISQTAKKILEALEHFSSPISDAKKIPLKNTNNALSSVMGRKRAREEIASPSARIGMRHLTRELTVPTVPDILKLRRRQKLQDTTLAARKIVSSRSDPPPPPQEYRLRMDDADNEKYRGKLKGKSKINLEQEETVAPVNLPNVPLPITTLPNFNFTLPFPALHSAGKTIANKENTFTFASPIKMPEAEKNLQSVNNFTFSNPINADDSTSKTIDSSSGSITENVGSIGFSSTDSTTTSMPNFIWSGSSTAPRLKAKVKNKDDFGEPVVAHEQKSGSVMNVLYSKSNKIESTLTGQSNSGLVSEMTYADKIASPDSDIKNDAILWECSECLIKNSGTDKQCTACKFARPNPNDKTSTSTTCSTSTIDTIVKSKPVADDCFGSQFKLSTNQWECTVCCVRNKQSDVKCVACYALKPGSKSAIQQTVKSQAHKFEKLDHNLMEKFKPAEGSWECHGCLLRNAANVITCPCCNASKPTSIKTNLKKTDTVTDSSSQKSSTADTDNTATQETSSNYQIMNKSSKPTSIKSSPKKTDAVIESSPQKLSTADTDNTAMQGTTSNDEIMNKFKPSQDSWECPGCLVRNNNSITICPCCSTSKPNSLGGPSNKDQTSTNGFGDKFKKPEGSWNCDSCLLQNDANHTQCVACQALKPGTAKSNEPASSSTLQFKFGVPSGTSNLANHPSGFNFGIDKADNNSKSDTASPLNGFKFGAQQVMRNTSTNATTTCLPTFAQPTFTFSDSKTASQSTTIPTFGQVPTSSAALSTNLSFGENKLAETSTPSSNKSASDTPAATLFPIVTSSTSLFNNNESKTTIAFGTDKAPAFTATDSSKPSGFAMPEKIPTFGSNTQDSKPSVFGTPETKLPAVFNSPTVNPLPTFGIPSSSSATPSLFGSSNNSAAFGNNTTPAFGGTATTPTTLFSSTKPNVETNPAPNSSLFKFGSASTQQPATGSGFNFSTNVNPASSSTKPLFAFGNNSNTPSSNNMFGSGTFGANTASTNTNASFAFNTPKQETPATAFGQGAATTPMFGAPQTNPQTQATSPSFSSIPSSSTGFNFAAAAPSAAASGGFNFGGMSSTSTPTGGFNFNPPTTTPTVVFDPNSRPSFNFTKGSAPTTFNAPPQSASAPRKIKKAFRRCVR